jgi:hypothetical protein
MRLERFLWPVGHYGRIGRKRSRRVSLLRSVAAVVIVLAVGRLARPHQSTHDVDMEATLDVRIVSRDTDRPTPARVYLFKDGMPFRLSPVDLLLPLRVDLFYREQLWRRPLEAATRMGDRRTRTLEVSHEGESHFVLLDGQARYSLPPGRYRLEGYRGLCWAPAAEVFTLSPGERRAVTLTLEPVGGELGRGWVSGDDHIHLTRAREDDRDFLGWLEADDLSVGNFLQLQRQAAAAVQYAFGREGEATKEVYTIRAGEESRSEFYGHINMLGPSRLLRPVSVGAMYANSPEAYPFPSVLFSRGRALGAAVGYAHFDGSMKHSTMLMDLALGNVDFIEVFQFGVLKSEPWYDLLNAGLRVTGVAGSDFPANLAKYKPWPRAVPLLGPERTLVRAESPTVAGRTAFDVWAEKVRKGEAVVTNGPLLDFTIDGQRSGAVIGWRGGNRIFRGEARAAFFRLLDGVEVVVNGRVVAAKRGDGSATELSLPFEVSATESLWVAARAKGHSLDGEPAFQAHTNPVYLLRDRKPVMVRAAREAVSARWKKEAEYYRAAELVFASPEHRRELDARIDEATRILEQEPRPWP